MPNRLFVTIVLCCAQPLAVAPGVRAQIAKSAAPSAERLLMMIGKTGKGATGETSFRWIAQAAEVDTIRRAAGVSSSMRAMGKVLFILPVTALLGNVSLWLRALGL